MTTYDEFLSAKIRLAPNLPLAPGVAATQSNRTAEAANLYITGYSWSSDDASDDDEEQDEICLMCGGTERNHKPGCSDDDDLYY